MPPNNVALVVAVPISGASLCTNIVFIVCAARQNFVPTTWICWQAEVCCLPCLWQPPPYETCCVSLSFIALSCFVWYSSSRSISSYHCSPSLSHPNAADSATADDDATTVTLQDGESWLLLGRLCATSSPHAHTVRYFQPIVTEQYYCYRKRRRGFSSLA